MKSKTMTTWGRSSK